MNVNKKARELMVEYPKGITVEQLIKEIPADNFRMVVFGRMVYFAQQEEENRIFGDNLIK